MNTVVDVLVWTILILAAVAVALMGVVSWTLRDKGRPLFPVEWESVNVTPLVMCGACSPDGTLVAVGGSSPLSLSLWSVPPGTTPRWRRDLRGHTGPVQAVAFSPDGRVVASGSDDTTVRMWDATSGRQFGMIHTGSEVISLAFSPDGALLASGHNPAATKVWDWTSGEEIHSLPSEGASRALAFNPNGELLAVGGSGLTLWDVTSGERAQVLVERCEHVNALVFSPDGTVLLSAACSGGGGSIHVWNTTSWEVSQTLDGHSTVVTHIAFSADGTRFASSSFRGPESRGEGTIIVWDTQTREAMSTTTLRTPVEWLAFTGDGTRLAVGTRMMIGLMPLDQLEE